jgi:hypothetical protein
MDAKDIQLLTTGRIAQLLRQPPERIRYVLATQPQIRHSARAGRVRLYDSAAMRAIAAAIREMDTRREVTSV